MNCSADKAVPGHENDAIRSDYSIDTILGSVFTAGAGLIKSFSSIEKTRVFWSGGFDVAGEAAMRWAKANNGTTLEMTNIGKLLEKTGSLLPRKFESFLWNKASANFARNAKKSIEVFHNSAGIRVKSVWAKTEYPILQSNGVNINYHLAN